MNVVAIIRTDIWKLNLLISLHSDILLDGYSFTVYCKVGNATRLPEY